MKKKTVINLKIVSLLRINPNICKPDKGKSNQHMP